MFQIQALHGATFAHLFGLSDDELLARGVIPRRSVSDRGMPCRVSLRDARIGERALLLNYQHLKTSSPYCSSYAIYVIDGAEEAHLPPGALPPVFYGRQLAARGFGSDGLLKDAGLAYGEAIRDEIERLLERPDVDHVQVYNAVHGCYSARAVRV